MWEKHPGLQRILLNAIANQCDVKGGRILFPPNLSNKSVHVSIGGQKFLPLVVRARDWVCEIRITFLRRQNPGEIIQGGDLDNRLKTLFDGLRIPHDEAEAGKVKAEEDDAACFCLLEDDALVSSLSVETDRLYGPLQEEAAESDVELLIRVNVKKLNRDLGFI